MNSSLSRLVSALVFALALSATAVMVSAASRLPDSLELRALAVRPEYERVLKRVYLSIPDEVRAATTPEESAYYLSFIGHAYTELIQALPRYTTIDVTVSKARQAEALADLRAVAGTRTLTFHVFDDVSGGIDMWAQDIGERIRVDGRDRFLVPMPLAPGTGRYNDEISRSRAAVAHEVFGAEVEQADFVFEGGNLAFDRVDGRLRVFIGYNDVWLTVENYKRLGRVISVDDVKAMVSADFQGAEVIVIGTTEQSPLIFHIDQGFILLGDGTAVINRITDGMSQEKKQLDATRRQLQALGYRTIVIDHKQEHAARFQMSTNAVPFVNAETGQKTIIFPVFPGEVRSASLTVEQLGEADLQGKGLAAYRAYVSAGYRPIPIRDYAHVAGGNTHCITNVLD